MGSGTNMAFNIVTIVFLALTVITAFLVLGVMADSMDPPLFVPPTDVPPATIVVPPTIEPSPNAEELMMTQEAEATPVP